MAKLFFDDVHVIDGIPENPPDDGYALTFISLSDGEINARCVAADYGITCEGIHSERADRETPERVLGKAMFSTMEKLTGRRPPWGILTGVRPVRLVAEHSDDPMGFFIRSSMTRADKAELAVNIHNNSRDIISASGPDSCSLYIGIPFCPSRCSYCSFVSKTVENAGRLIEDYVEKHVKEIDFTGMVVQNLGLKVTTVYFGGGTPTSLSAEQLDRVMKAVSRSFDLSGIREYTVEGGRPETFTEGKLDVIEENGADRISINPQTMRDDILKAIGRRHTVDDVYRAFDMVGKRNFKAVNADLIAGLPGDSEEGFCFSLDRVLELSPENITVHTLCIKKSAFINENRPILPNAYEVERMLSYAYFKLDRGAYIPYYLYRQRNILANAENTGWSLPGKQCMYNVYSIDQTHTIVACGSGGVTILKQPCGNRIERIFNYKYPYEYIGRFGDILDRKGEITEFYRRFSG